MVPAASRRAVHHREVCLLDRIPALLQSITHLGAAGEEQHARGFTIQPMHHVRATRVPRFEDRCEPGEGRIVLLDIGGDGQQATRLLNRDEVFVFVQDCEMRYGMENRGCRGQCDAIRGADEMIVPRDRGSVDKNASVPQPLLDAVAARRFHREEQPREKRRVVRR